MAPSRSATPLSSAPFSPPLRLDNSPTTPHPSTFPSATSASSSRAPSRTASPTGLSSALRARKPPPPPGGASLTPTLSPTPDSHHSSSNTPAVDSDVTRPSLRRVTNDLASQTTLHPDARLPRNANGHVEGDYSLRLDKGKGRAVNGDQRRAVSESHAQTGPDKDREVIVHKLAKTDTIASVSLQYGITPQALRTANRLWPSDPLFLRPHLLIPLDACNLPSSSFGVERIAREENGDLTVWRRGGGGGAENGGGGAGGGGLGGAAKRAEGEDGVLSPKARRLASVSAFDFTPPSTPSTAAAPPTPPPPVQNEFLDVWSSPSSSARASLDTFPAADTPFSSHSLVLAPSPPALPPPLPRTSSHLIDLTSTSTSFTDPISPPSSSSGGTHPHASSTSSSGATSPPPPQSSSSSPSSPSSHSSPSGGKGQGVEKRTLRVERMPASQFAYFPAPSAETTSPTKPNFSSASSAFSSSAGRPNSQQQRQRQDGESESLFFGPLSNSLTSSFPSLSRLSAYLPSSSSSSSLSSRIRLPPSPGQTLTRSKWSILNFGAEEEEMAAASGATSSGGGGGGGYFGGLGLGVPRSTSLGGGGGGGGEGLGLTDSGTWRGGGEGRRASRHKVKDSSEGLENGQGKGKARGGLGGLFDG